MRKRLPQELKLKFLSEIILQRSLSLSLLLKLSEYFPLSRGEPSRLYPAVTANSMIVQKVARDSQVTYVGSNYSSGGKDIAQWNWDNSFF